MPGGTGKSWLSPLVAFQLGLSPRAIVDEWIPARGITPGALHVTNSLTAPIPEGVTAIYAERG